MKCSIPKENTYIDITGSGLQSYILSSSERKAVSHLIHQLNRKPLICTCLAVALAFTFLSITLYNISIDRLEKDSGMFIFCGLFFIIGLLLSRQLIFPHTQYLKAQHGILNGIWSSSTLSRHSRVYYMDVVFPDTGTRCRKVICCRQDYLRAKPNTHILVVSFDEKNIYGLIIQSEINTHHR